MAVSKPCLFCGVRSPLSKEHVLPDWLSRIGLDMTPVTQAAGRILGSPHLQWTAPPFTQTVRAVCKPCNTGWMSTIETAAKRAAEPLIHGRSVHLTAEDQAILSVWAFKTALIGTLVFSDRQRANGYGLPDTEYELLYRWRERVGPPPRTQFWIGRYGGATRPWSVWVTPIAIDVPGADPDLPDGYLITVIVGQMLVHGVRLHESIHTLQVESAVELTMIWPASDEIDWLDTAEVGDDAVDRMHKGTGLTIHVGAPGADNGQPLQQVAVRHWTGIRRSEGVGSMVEAPTPCGEHVIRYPAVLAHAAVHHGVIHVFCTSCACDIGYLAATQPDGTHFRSEGPPALIAARYEILPWEEFETADENGIFLCRRVPSLEALDRFFEPTS